MFILTVASLSGAHDIKDDEIARLKSQLAATQTELAGYKSQEDDGMVMSTPSPGRHPSTLLRRDHNMMRPPFFPTMPSMGFGGLPSMGFPFPSQLFGGSAMGNGGGGMELLDEPRCHQTASGGCECVITLPRGDTAEMGDVAVKSKGKTISLQARSAAPSVEEEASGEAAAAVVAEEVAQARLGLAGAGRRARPL